jgi:hypothetical protein
MQHVGGDATAQRMSAAASAEPAHVAPVADDAHMSIAGLDAQAQHGFMLKLPRRGGRCKWRDAMLVLLLHY